MLGRACTFIMPSGRLCRATPLRDEPFCFWHSPETAEEAAEARRLGGLHRRKKKTIGAVYGFQGLRTIEDNQALLETAAIETLALENSIARNRALAGYAAVGAKLIEVGDHEERLRRSRPHSTDRRLTTRTPSGTSARDARPTLGGPRDLAHPHAAHPSPGWTKPTPSGVSTPMSPPCWTSPRRRFRSTGWPRRPRAELG